jgi:hypothetical protein
MAARIPYTLGVAAMLERILELDGAPRRRRRPNDAAEE